MKDHDMWQCPNCKAFQWDLPQEGLKKNYYLCVNDFEMCGRIIKKSDVHVTIPKEYEGMVLDNGKLSKYENWIKQ